jgi:hypothetical protein
MLAGKQANPKPIEKPSQSVSDGAIEIIHCDSAGGLGKW